MLQIYKKHKRLKDSCYNDQYFKIKDEAIASIGEWPDYFSKIDVECKMICVNNPFIQETWCNENHFEPEKENQEFSIVIEQIRKFAPSHLIVMNPGYLNQDNRFDKLLYYCPSIKTKICWYGAPSGEVTFLKNYDCVLIPSKNLTEKYQNDGLKCFHLNHAFEPRILDLVGVSKQRKNKICFIGSLNSGNEWYNQRISYLERISKEVEIDIYSNVQKLSYYQRSKHTYIFKRHSLCKFLLKRNIKNNLILNYSDKNNLPRYDRLTTSQIAKKINPPRYGLDMLKLLSSYRFTFNMHIPLSGSTAGNLRLTEALGLGTCLLTDSKINNNEFLCNYADRLSYNTANDCINKIISLMNNNDLVDEITTVLKENTLLHYSTSNQFDRLHKIICN